MTPSRQTRRAAFTLIELLIVLALIMIVVGLTLPAMDALQRSGRGAAAANSISSATNAARIYNHRIERADLGDAAGSPFDPFATYAGTAALFTPASEIRLVETDQQATSGPDPDDFLQRNDRTGYRDIGEDSAGNQPSQLDYISLPRSAWVVGVRYDSAGDMEVLPPPFAVRFSEFGHIATDQDYIYYRRGEDDGGAAQLYYEVDFGRDEFVQANGDYDPGEWSRHRAEVSDVTGKRKLPFDRIEVVTGVISFNRREFRTYEQAPNVGVDDSGSYAEFYKDLGPRLRQAYAGAPPDPATRRLAENSTPINFSPLTGLSIRASAQ